MLVLKIIGVILVGAAFLFSIIKFNHHCDNKFGHTFFNKVAFVIITIAVILFLTGNGWYRDALKTNGDTLNGIVLIAISAIICLTFIIYNTKETNLLYGILGSLAQIIIFGAIGSVSIILLVCYVVLNIMVAMSAKPVYVINK